MKAAICTQYGPPNVLQIAEVAKPTPKAGEILIKIHATTVSVADARVRGFRVPGALLWLPMRLVLGITKPKQEILGMEIAGEVEAVGRSVTRFNVGDTVYANALSGFGGYAEYICLPENGVVVPKPNNLSFEEAAAVPIGAGTALHFLKKANVQTGQKVLIYGASGSVGTYAVQLAKHFGAEVTAVCSTTNIAMVKSLGADHVIDYTQEEFSAGTKQYDIIFETVNKSTFAACQKVLKADGTYINIASPLPTLAMLRAKFTTHQRLIVGETAPDTAEILLELKEYIESGHLKPIVDRCYPLEKIAEAHAYVDKEHKKGNVVITVANS